MNTMVFYTRDLRIHRFEYGGVGDAGTNSLGAPWDYYHFL